MSVRSFASLLSHSPVPLTVYNASFINVDCQELFL
nr:MAG TPA: hypothetical protein [Caudoviricetes sp.]